MPLTTLLSKKKIDACVQRAKNGGAEIVGLLKTGSAYYAPAAATVEMVEAVLLDKKRDPALRRARDAASTASPARTSACR